MKLAELHVDSHKVDSFLDLIWLIFVLMHDYTFDLGSKELHFALVFHILAVDGLADDSIEHIKYTNASPCRILLF